jgi:hypothetical protein
MRLTKSLGIGLVLAMAAAACGGTGSGDDTTPADDAPGDDTIDPPTEGFQLVSPDITLAPGEEVTKCWYFQTPNTVEKGITRWESQMTPGSHHMIVFFSDELQEAPGTIVEDCGFTGSAGAAVWTYSSQRPQGEQQLPEGVGMKVNAGQYGFIQMHYLNTGEGNLDAHVTLNVVTHPDGTTYTRAAPYITFHNDISIPPNSDATFSGSCPVPTDRDFYQLGTHAHKQAVHMQVEDGASMVYQTDSWSDAEAAEWLDAPYHRFASGTLNYSCDYHNPTGRTITTGDSAATDEMCMAVGYMFPADRPTLCVHFNGQDIILQQ